MTIPLATTELWDFSVPVSAADDPSVSQLVFTIMVERAFTLKTLC